MRHTLRLSTFLFLSVICSSSFLKAADTLVVDPGTGTLETAINKHGGDVIYFLQAGEQYLLNGVVNVLPQILGGSGKTLTIVGEKTEGMPAIIQVGSQNNKPLPSMFSCSANLTLRNLFLTDKDENGAFGQNVISLNAPVKLIMDHCVIDPAGTKRTFNGGAAANGSKLYLTNSQIYRNGSMDSPNDGGWLGGMQWDTLWVENNTLVSSGQDFIGGSFHREPNNQFIWINHNTIMWHDVWIKKSFNDQNVYFTNNILHDESLFPELPRWYPFFPDFEQGNNLLCQTAIDTLEVGGVTETLPSKRRMLWAYNLMYYSPELKKVPKYAADNHIELAYLLPMLWDGDVPLSYSGDVEVLTPEDFCRENRILADKQNWPLMKYSNNWYDIDPFYNDPQIYAISDSAGQHILGFYRGQFWNEPDAPKVEDLPSYNWDIDAYHGYGPAELPQAWPRFDGSYTHPELLTSSLEGLPLGDLNWYPDQKFQWLANKERIETHILDLHEDRFDLLDPDSILYHVKLTVVNEHNHPIEGAVLVLGEDTLGLTGRYGLIELDTLAGSYGYTCSAPAYEENTGTFTVAYSKLAKSITLRSIVGVNPLPVKYLRVKFYPNPTREILYLEGDELAGARIQVLNLTGSIQKEEVLHSEKSSLSVAGLTEGLYIVRISKDNKQYNGKITIEH